MLVAILLFSLPFLAGLFLWRLGRRGRLMNDHTVCAACRFDLVGVYPASQTCPECGNSLDQPDSVTRGVRQPRPRLAWAGITLAALSLLLGVGWGAGAAVGSGLNRYLPTTMLIAKARRAQGPNAAPALTELERRFTAGLLRPAQIDEIVVTTLDVQSRRDNYRWHTAWGDLFDSIAAAGHVSGDDYATYIRQAIKLTLEPRSRIHFGQAVPLRLSTELDRAGAHSLWYLRNELGDVTLDGRPTQRFGYGYSSTSLQHGTSSSSTSTYPLSADVGTHTLRAAWKVAVTLSRDDNAERLAEWEVSIETPLEIVDPSQPIITLARDERMASEFRDNARVQFAKAWRRDSGKTHVELHLYSDRRPIPVAMEAFLVCGQHSWRVGTVTLPKSNGMWSSLLNGDLDGLEAALAEAGVNGHQNAGADASALFLELRPNLDAAEHAVGFDEILGPTVSLPVQITWQE
ncbi:MAG: hypothetical protein KJZ65_14410 [Phycisphaerales bacterium]|nr:hypothetical protein [Phycisphaerales bacterium]